MRVPREAWWLAGLIAVMVVVAAVARGGGAPSTNEYLNRTTYSRAPWGVRALYLTLEELGYDARRLRAPFAAATLPRQGALVMVGPAMPVTTHEWRALYRWVAAGHTLFLAGDWMLPSFEWSYPAIEEEFDLAPLSRARPVQPTYLARDVERLAVRAAWRINRPGAAMSDEEPPPRACPGGACSVAGEPPDRLGEALRRAVPLFTDHKGTVAAYSRIGKGAVVVLCGGWSLSNDGIGTADNLTFTLNALGPPRAGPVYFDEYHHGYGEQLLWTVMPLPVKLGLAQLALAVLVVMYARSRRFGAIIPLDRGRRERSEFLGTMTALLRKGQATRLALRTAYEAALQDLRVALGVAADANAAQIAEAAARVSEPAAEELGQVLRQCRGALEGPETLTEARALGLVRQLDGAVRGIKQI